MREIHSKVEPTLLLHCVHRMNTLEPNVFYRKNLSNDDQYLQVSYLRMPKDHTFKPHQHIFKDAPDYQVVAQESWVVVSGQIRVFFYDIDETFLESVVLEVGDMSITFRGGHSYQALEAKSIVYEYKTGPYTGVENDKVFFANSSNPTLAKEIDTSIKVYESPDSGQTIYERTMLKNDRKKI